MVAAMLAAAAAPPAFAQEQEDEEAEERARASLVLFGSMEAGPAKTFVASGVKRAIGSAGFYGSGFRTLVSMGLGTEQAPGRVPHGMVRKLEGQTLIGYEWRFGGTFLALYAGQDFEIEQSPCGCGWLTTLRVGTRLLVDLWTTPTERTMVQAAAYASTLDRRAWLRLAGGWTVPTPYWLSPRDVYLGPEIEAYRQNGYDKLRLGLHVTGLHLLGLGWRLSGGWQRTSDRGSGAYVTLGAHWRR